MNARRAASGDSRRAFSMALGTIRMDAAGLHERYRQLQQYLDWGDGDAQRVQAAGAVVRPAFPRIVEDFYEEIKRHEQTYSVITGGEQQIERLKVTLDGWLQELFSGRYDADFVAGRFRVARRHVGLRLPQIYVNAALARIRRNLGRELCAGWRGDPSALAATLESVNKLLDLELAILEHAYWAEHLAQQQRTERLATIGQMAGGIAHELRNPLNAVRMSVYYLLNAKNPAPGKREEHLERIDRQIEVADGVVTALSDFSKLPLPNLQPVWLVDCVRQVLDNTPLSASIEVVLENLDELPPALGDEKQLQIVLGNLIRNARDAMPDGGRLRVMGYDSGNRVELAVADTGVGIPAEEIERIMEPLYSTKARGIGLGLAISRSILEKHDGGLCVHSRPGHGSRFTIWLAKASD